jgi:serine/threonine-protein kinase
MIGAHGAPRPDTALDLIAQISAGLADAHASGLVHRDIKPANVLLRIRGQEVSAYLADFGIARRTDVDPNLNQTLSTQGFAVGTPSYMAPELHTGGRPSTATDVYSLGCLLWAALVGSAPYAGTTGYQLVSAHVTAAIPQLAAPGQFEREVNRILRTAMAKHAGERYPAAAAMRDDLRRVLRTYPAPASVRAGTGQEPPTPAPTPGSSYVSYAADPAPTPYPASPGSRSGVLIGLGLALVLVVVIGVVAAVAIVSNNGDSDNGRAIDVSRASSPASSDRTAPTGSTGQGGLTPDEQRAADNIAAVLRADSNFSTLDADCTARKLVEQSGIQGLQDQGLLDGQLNFVGDINPASNPQVFTDIFSVSVSCVFESVSFPATN